MPGIKATIMFDHMASEHVQFSQLNYSATWHFSIIMATAEPVVMEVTKAESEDITASATASNNGSSLLNVLKPVTKSDLGRKENRKKYQFSEFWEEKEEHSSQSN